MSQSPHPNTIGRDASSPSQFYNPQNVPPVTPGIHTSGRSAYIEESDEHEDSREFKNGTTSAQAQVSEASSDPDPRPVSPTDVAKGAKSGEELLRRLSIADTGKKKIVGDTDPRAAHPALQLSGNIISATFCVPYNLGYCPGEEWVSDHFRLIHIMEKISRLNENEGIA
jgi:trehalose 6-phosphate synthase/phosphatase